MQEAGCAGENPCGAILSIIFWESGGERPGATILREEEMSEIGVNQKNVGRIAERIVANELEYRGFRVSDLNKEGTSANADLLAAKAGKTWQIQVKGATEGNAGWWFNYGYCDEDIIRKKKPMFNRQEGFYEAQFVALVSVKSPAEYACLVLPVKVAEEAAQINLNHGFRTPKKDGTPKKPGKMWCDLDYVPKTKDTSKRNSMEREQEILKPYRDKWDVIDASS
jgi:hypothetical protein